MNKAEAFNKFMFDYTTKRGTGCGAMNILLIADKIVLADTPHDGKNGILLGVISKFEFEKGLTPQTWAAINRIFSENFDRKVIT